MFAEEDEGAMVVAAVDFESLCRLCCSSTEPPAESHRIAGACERLIQDTLPGVGVAQDDGLPENVCGSCHDTLERFHRFRLGCIRVQRFLRAHPRVHQEESQVEASTPVVVQLVLGEEQEVVEEGHHDHCDTYGEEPLQVADEDTASVGQEQLHPDSEFIEATEMQQLGLQRCLNCQLLFKQTELHECPSHTAEEPTRDTDAASAKQAVVQKLVEFLCEECGKIFRKRETLLEHIMLHLGHNPYVCKICSKSFKRRTCLRKHARRHANKWSYLCQHCDRGFVDKNVFDYHIRSAHTSERPFACDRCGRAYRKKQDLVTHINNIHETFKQPLQECGECGKAFIGPDALRHHLRTHKPLEQRRTHKCPECPASYTSSNGLKRHMLSHTGELPFACPQCPCKLKTKKGLEAHLLNHTGVKSFMCDVCGFSFALANTLRVHMRRHTGERPYSCAHCKKSFVQLSALTYHKKSCNGDNGKS